MTITHEIVDLTPDLAAELLASTPAHQRKITQNHVDRISRAMTTGGWVFNPQPLIIDTNGALTDGQHRCAAVIQSGVTIPVVIVRGADPEVFALVDTGRTRQASQFVPGQYGTTIAAAARLVLAFRATGGQLRAIDYERSMITNKQILDDVEADEEYQLAAPQIAAIRKAAKINAVPLLAVHILASRNVDPDLASLWLSGLETGEDLAKGDPRLVLRNKWIQDGSRIRGISLQWSITVKAWNAHLAGREIKQLRWRKIDGIPAVSGAAVAGVVPTSVAA